MAERQRPLCFGTTEVKILTPGKKTSFICSSCWVYNECVKVTPKTIHPKIKINKNGNQYGNI